MKHALINTRMKKHTTSTSQTSTQQTASSVNICSSGGCFCFPLSFHHQGLAVKLFWYCCYFNHRPRCNWHLVTLSNPHQSLIKYANASWGWSGWTHKNKQAEEEAEGEAGMWALGKWYVCWWRENKCNNHGTPFKSVKIRRRHLSTIVFILRLILMMSKSADLQLIEVSLVHLRSW